MIVLCTNDDGHEAGGLGVLARAAAALGEVWTVAPDREQSATSHALALGRPLRVQRTRPRVYHVDGTPTDCVLFPHDALFNVNLPAIPPDRVRGVRFTRLGRRVYTESITRRLDPTGRESYWIGGGEMHWSGLDDADYRAVEAGYVSVTPLHLDLRQ